MEPMTIGLIAVGTGVLACLGLQLHGISQTKEKERKQKQKAERIAEEQMTTLYNRLEKEFIALHKDLEGEHTQGVKEEWFLACNNMMGRDGYEATSIKQNFLVYAYGHSGISDYYQINEFQRFVNRHLKDNELYHLAYRCLRVRVEAATSALNSLTSENVRLNRKFEMGESKTYQCVGPVDGCPKPKDPDSKGDKENGKA